MNKIPEIRGDSLSQLLQLRAHMVGVSLKWTGNAVTDIDLLCKEYFHRKALNECLWNGLRQLMEMPELKELPDSLQAQIYSIILRAKANFESQHNEMMVRNPAAPPMPPQLPFLPRPT